MIENRENRDKFIFWSVFQATRANPEGAFLDDRLMARAVVTSRRGRDFAASLGLTPRQHGSGGRGRLLGISKRGDSYLRKLLVHGTRVVLRHVDGKDDGLSHWLKGLASRKHINVATAASANKIACIAWAPLRAYKTAG